MANLSKTRRAFLNTIMERDLKLPNYHRAAKKMRDDGYLRLSDPDEFGDCAINLTAKGREALTSDGGSKRT